MLSILTIVRSPNRSDAVFGSRVATLFAGLLAIHLFCSGIARAEETQTFPLQRLDAGTLISAENVQGWTGVVLLATPQVTSGDVANVSKMIIRYAEMFTTILTANTQQTLGRYRLSEVGVGLAVAEGPNFRVVSASQRSKEPDKASASLGMIATSVLKAAERSLDKMTVSFHHDSAVLVDCPALVAVQGKHQELLARHLVWVHPKSGSISSAVWFVEALPVPKVFENKGVLLPAGFRETRRLHVSQAEFLFGIPSERAFALETLPAGKPFQFDEASSAAAVSPSWSLEELQIMAEHLSREASR